MGSTSTMDKDIDDVRAVLDVEVDPHRSMIEEHIQEHVRDCLEGNLEGNSGCEGAFE